MGRKASTYPFKLLAILSNWLAFATTPFVVLTAVLIALTAETDFGDLVVLVGFKLLPSMQSSSHDRSSTTKRKQVVRAKCAIAKLKGSNGEKKFKELKYE